MAVFSAKDRENAKKVASKCSNDRNKHKSNESTNDDGGATDDNLFLGLDPSELLVIAGIVGGVLEVISVLVDRNQAIQIVLSGELKRKTQMDMMMEQIGSMPFDQVIKAIMNNVT